ELENQLTTKSKMLEELKQSLAFKGSADQTPETLSLRIPELCEMMDSLVSQVAQVKSSMLSVVEKWRSYEDTYKEIKLKIIRYAYFKDHNKCSAGSLNTVKHQVKILK
ncbi:SYNE2 protein, partial [Rhinopomastus cyanomelas]|nr:SYNE2 protein [Rhinopomastus cyanomelas]